MIFGVFKELLWKKCALNWQRQKQPRKVRFVCWHCNILINVWDLLRLTKKRQKTLRKNLFLFLPHFAVICFVSFVHFSLGNLINSCRLRILKTRCSLNYRFRVFFFVSGWSVYASPCIRISGIVSCTCLLIHLEGVFYNKPSFEMTFEALHWK